MKTRKFVKEAMMVLAFMVIALGGVSCSKDDDKKEPDVPVVPGGSVTDDAASIVNTVWICYDSSDEYYTDQIEFYSGGRGMLVLYGYDENDSCPFTYMVRGTEITFIFSGDDGEDDVEKARITSKNGRRQFVFDGYTYYLAD